MNVSNRVRAGTRISQLARWQTGHVIALLQASWPELEFAIQTFNTEGDRNLDRPLPAIGGKGLFTAALENALLAGDIDIAVHSLKDLPVEDPPGLALGAILGRADVRDVLVSRERYSLDSLPHAAVVGTSSLRRQAQLLAARPDLQVRSIRGNVETRIRKVMEGQYDAAVLAAAGLERLGLARDAGTYLTVQEMLPAPGQGALAVQCRAGDARILALLSAVNDQAVRAAVTAERAFLHALGGGCAVPVAAFAQAENDGWLLQGLVSGADGAPIIHVAGSGADPRTLGEELAGQANLAGAGAILDHIKPLRNRRVVVTRSAGQADEFAQRLSAMGAEAIIFPVISFVPCDQREILEKLAEVGAYAWLLFTSVNAVHFFFAAYDTLDAPPILPKVAAVGEATGRLLGERGITPDFVPTVFTGEKLALGLGDVHGQRILLPRARAGRPEITEVLRSQGAVVDDVPLYETVMADPPAEALAELRRGADTVTFTSPSSVRNFRKILEKAGTDPDEFLTARQTVCIGPSTAAQLEAYGLVPDLVPNTYTIEGMIAAMIDSMQGVRH